MQGGYDYYSIWNDPSIDGDGIFEKIPPQNTNENIIENVSTYPSNRNIEQINHNIEQKKGETSFLISDFQSDAFNSSIFNPSMGFESNSYEVEPEIFGIVEGGSTDEIIEESDYRKINKENMQRFLGNKTIREEESICLIYEGEIPNDNLPNLNLGRRKNVDKNEEKPGKHTKSTPDNLCKKIKKEIQESGLSFYNLIFREVFSGLRREEKDYIIQKLTKSVNSDVKVSSNKKWFSSNEKLYKYFSETITDNRIRGSDDDQNKKNFERIFKLNEVLNHPLINLCKEITIVDFYNKIFLADKPAESQFLFEFLGENEFAKYYDLFAKVKNLDKLIEEEKKRLLDQLNRKGKVPEKGFDGYYSVLRTYAKEYFIQRFCKDENRRNKKFYI